MKHNRNHSGLSLGNYIQQQQVLKLLGKQRTRAGVDKRKSYQEVNGPHRSSSVVTGELCFLVCLFVCLFKIGSHFTFSGIQLLFFLPIPHQKPELRAGVPVLLLHHEPSRAAKFWLVNTVCVLGVAVSTPGKYCPRKEKASEALLKPCT